jgi:N-acetylneuraminic acid mutarotase
MRRYPFLVIVLALSSLGLAACGDKTTEAGPGTQPEAAVPELAAAQNTWRTRADMWGIERWNFAAAVVPNSAGQSVLYTIGGEVGTGAETGTGSTVSRVMAYNAATNVWTLKSPLPIPLKQSNGAGVVGGKIYVSGGLRSANDQSYSDALYVYNPATNTWTRKRDMPSSGLNGFTGVINDKLYVVTSCFNDDNCNFTGKWLYQYDPATDIWTQLATPTLDMWYRDRLVGGTIGKKLYIGTPGSSTLGVYDPVSNTWSQKATNTAVRYGAASTTLNAKLYMMGGINGTGTEVRTTNVYDPSTNTWTTAAPLPTPRTSTSAVRLAFNGPKIELAGGTRPGNNLQYVP